MKGIEVTSLARLIPFAIARFPILIPYAHKRPQAQTSTVGGVEPSHAQYYTDTEFGALDERVLEAMRGMHYLTDILQRHVFRGPPGGGAMAYALQLYIITGVFDTLKSHLLGGAANFARRFGSLRIIDTEAAEAL